MPNDRLERSVYLIMMVSLTIVSIALTSIIFKSILSRENLNIQTRTPRRQENFTFMGDDFPESLVPDAGKVRFVVEESVRFALDLPESKTEWLSTSPPGTGHVVRIPILYAPTILHKRRHSNGSYVRGRPHDSF